MKHYLFLLLTLLTFASCSANDPEIPEQPQPVQPGEGGGSDYFSGKKVLIAYFSWGGTTRRMAQQIQAITGVTCLKLSQSIHIRHHILHALK